MPYLDGKMKKHTLVLALTICPIFNGFGDLCKFCIFLWRIVLLLWLNKISLYNLNKIYKCLTSTNLTSILLFSMWLRFFYFSSIPVLSFLFVTVTWMTKAYLWFVSLLCSSHNWWRHHTLPENTQERLCKSGHKLWTS